MSTLYDLISRLLAWLLSWIWWLLQFVWEVIEEKLIYAVGALVLAVARMLGTVIQTGWRGVLFRFGRVHKELPPGFHFLVPIVHAVRKLPVRSVSFHLPPQRIVTRDGLVYDVEANLVYHVEHPTIATVQIDDVHRGCRVVVPLVVAELIGRQTSESLADRARLDDELATALQARFDRWGLAVERAGFKSISPTRESLRITQLAVRCDERLRVYRGLLSGGESASGALALLGAPTRLIERSAACYRSYRRPYTTKRPSPKKRLPRRVEFRVGDRVWVNWMELGEYYPGRVAERFDEYVHIRYDDGDEETVVLAQVRREEPKN